MVARPGAPNVALAATIAREHLPTPASTRCGGAVEQQTRRNRALLDAVIERPDLRPRPTQVARCVEMQSPPVVFGARRTNDRAVGELDRLVLDPANDALPQSPPPGPNGAPRGPRPP